MKSAFILVLLFCLGFLPSSKGNPAPSNDVENGNAERIPENFDESSKDNSAFDKLLAINEKEGQKAKFFEGDILEDKFLKEMIENRKRGAASNQARHLWPIKNGKHEVPYQIDGVLASSSDVIIGAMREWMEKVPCLNFVQREDPKGHLYFYRGPGCSSYVGNIERRQPVSLATGCMYHGIVVHEIGHALGFFHEQSRSDRDEFLTIHWENIRPETRRNFEKLNGKTDDTSHGYDYASIMQYGPKAFSINGRNTITAKNGASIGQRNGLSDGDVQQAKTMFTACEGGSTGGGGGGGSTGGGGEECSPDKNRNCEYWANRGYCRHSFVEFMKKNCKKSCCSVKVTNECSPDKYRQCQSWAAMGFCSHSYVAFMKQNCGKSCCSTGCLADKYRNCNSWARMGYCRRSYETFMMENCKKSCCSGYVAEDHESCKC